MDNIYLIIGFVIGAIVAVIVFYLYNKTKNVSKKAFEDLSATYNEAVANAGIFQERIKTLQENNYSLNEKLSTKEDAVASLQTKSTVLETTLSSKENKIGELAEQLTFERAVNQSLQQEINRYKDDIADLKASNNFLKEKLDTQKEEIESLQKNARIEFENIANKLLDEKSQKFTEANKINIEALLKPFKDDVNEFRNKVQEETSQRVSLGDKVKDLIEQTNKISKEANDLATALKGQTKTQGNWGEMILERILEFSGLTKGREYYTQHNIKDEDGKNLRPDVIVNLPEDRAIIIDSKVSLNAYEKFSSAENEADKQSFLREHLKSIYNHINELSGKKYDSLQNSLDYIMMFIPIEPAFLMAVQSDQNLWDYAYAKKIILISPTNLIACLKIISDLWKREKQNRNNEEIVKRGELLYNKLVNFISSVDEIGNYINKTQSVYNKAVDQMKNGRGNLIGQAMKLKELGDFKSNQKIPANMLPLEYEDEAEQSSNV